MEPIKRTASGILSTTAAATASGFTSQDLRLWGLKELAYIRSIVVKERRVFVIHGADGVPVAVQGSLQDARSLAESQTLTVLAIH